LCGFDTKVIPDHQEVQGWVTKCDEFPHPPETKPAVFQIGLSMSSYKPHNAIANAHNEYNAVTTRQIMQTLPSLKWTEPFEFCKENFNKIYPAYEYKLWTFQEWNTKGTFSAARQKNHVKAYNELQHLTKQQLYRKSFVKLEIMHILKTKNVRCISGASDTFNVLFGPPLYSFSKALSKTWNKDHWILYTSGTTCEDVSDWLLNQCVRMGVTFPGETFILMDESRQDAHVSAQSLLWEIKMLEVMGVDSSILEDLKRAIKVIGITSKGLLYGRKGGRNTGDPHTSSGNSHMNAIKTIIGIIRILKSKSIEIDLNNPPFCLCIQGDDSLIYIKNKIATYITSEELIAQSVSFGFNLRFVTITKNIVDVDYISRLFWPTNSHPLGYVLGPKIGRVLSKIGFCRHAVQEIYPHIRGVAMGLKADVHHVPFLREWNESMLRITTGVEPKEMPFDYSMHSRGNHSYCERTWTFLLEKYNLTGYDLECFKQMLSNVKTLPYHLNYEGIEEIIACDK